MNKFYRCLYKLLARLIRFLYRIEIRGAENEVAQGPLLVCINHTALTDVFVAAVCMHRQLHFMAKAELFRIPVLRSLISALGAFPVKRGAGDVHAIKKTLSILSEGKAVGIFPQGTRRPGVHPSQTEPKSGVGLIAYRSHCTVQPIGISTKGYKLRMFRRTVVTIGKPIPFEELHMTSGTPDEYARAAAQIFSHITDIVE